MYIKPRTLRRGFACDTRLRTSNKVVGYRYQRRRYIRGRAYIWTATCCTIAGMLTSTALPLLTPSGVCHRRPNLRDIPYHLDDSFPSAIVPARAYICLCCEQQYIILEGCEEVILIQVSLYTCLKWPRTRHLTISVKCDSQTKPSPDSPTTSRVC